MEEFYLSISINALKDFRNVFTNAFLRDHEKKLLSYTHMEIEDDRLALKLIANKDICICYKYDPLDEDKSIYFRFTGDGFVYLRHSESDKEISCKCHPSENARDHISDTIYDAFGVIINL